MEDKFYFCLTQMSRLSERPDNLEEEIFRKLFDVSEFAQMTRDQQRQYVKIMTTERDVKNQISYARKEALAEGEAAGLEKGRAEGEAVGLEKGRAEGRADIARAMKAKGIALELIAECTGLTAEEILRLE